MLHARRIHPAILAERLASIDLTTVESDQDIRILEYRRCWP